MKQVLTMEGNQDDDRPGFSDTTIATVVEKEVAERFDVSPDIAVPLAARENRPDVLKHLIREGKPTQTQDIHGWTALHHAAFLGHVECVRILLDEETCNIDVTAGDGSTPLTAACSNLPKAKDCVKVLCEHKANPNLFAKKSDYSIAIGTYDRARTALLIAIESMPDLDVTKWLVDAGADVKSYVEPWNTAWGGPPENEWNDKLNHDLMMCLFQGVKDLEGDELANHPAYSSATPRAVARPDVTEVAEIAMYLAKHGAAKRGQALHAVLLPHDEGWNPYEGQDREKGYNLMPPLLNEVVDCFMDNGGDLHSVDLLLQNVYVWRPSVLFLYARKSIVFIEGIPTHADDMWTNSRVLNTLMVLVIKGHVSGTLTLTDVAVMHFKLRKHNLEGRLPTNFRPLEIFKALTKSPPSLRQLARTKIRSQIAKGPEGCRRLSRKKLKKLPDLPEILMEYLQLSDLDELWIRHGSEFEEIARLAENYE